MRLRPHEVVLAVVVALLVAVAFRPRSSAPVRAAGATGAVGAVGAVGASR